MSTEKRRNGRLKSILRQLGAWATVPEALIFPSVCELCGSFLAAPGEQVVCSACWAKVRPAREPACPVCGLFFDAAVEPHFCGGCLASRPPFSRHRSSGRYEGALKDMILLFKYRRFEALGPRLAEHLCRTLAGEEDLWSGVDGVVPVPLHPRRLKERGFNQAEILARMIARSRGIRLMSRHLVRRRYTPPQTVLEREERERNVRGAFRIRRREDLRGKILLLVDDVFTTGSTLRECARALLDGGAKEVRAVTLARA